LGGDKVQVLLYFLDAAPQEYVIVMVHLRKPKRREAKEISKLSPTCIASPEQNGPLKRLTEVDFGSFGLSSCEADLSGTARCATGRAANMQALTTLVAQSLSFGCPPQLPACLSRFKVDSTAERTCIFKEE
jgi:hypothetical protein